MTDGRFTVRDLKTGRVFVVEPVENRSERDTSFASLAAVRRDGAVAPQESQITPENGFRDIATVENPLDEIERRCGAGARPPLDRT